MKSKIILWWGAVFSWMAVIFYFSSQPQGVTPPFLPDYVLHFIEYAILSVLVFKALVDQGKEWSLTRISALAVIITVFYAATDEFHQAFVSTRMASLGDWLADCLATFLVVGSGAIILKFISHRKSTT